MNFLTLSGSPFDRGRAYGEALRGEIVEQVQFFRGLILNQAHLDPDDFFAHLLTLGWREAAEVWTPHLLDEVRGIAEGANLPFADLFAWQSAQEVFWYMPQYLQSSSGPTAGCSVVADAGDDVHPTILAQNADTIPFWHQHQTLLRILPASDEEPEQLIMTYPGLIGPYGLNSAGIGICVNALFHNLNNSTQGLPTPLLTRAVLSKRTFAEAVSFIQEVPHASGNTLTVGGPGSVVAFEVSENAVVPFMLSDTPYRTCHTNHVLVSDDFQPNASRDSHPNSADRMAMLMQGLADIPDHLTVDDVKGLLSSHGARAQLCRHEDDAWGSMTTYAMIMELDRTPRLHVSFGPPCREPFQTFDFAGPPAPEV